MTSLLDAIAAVEAAERIARKRRDLDALERRLIRAARAHWAEQRDGIMPKLDRDIAPYFREAGPIDLFGQLWADLSLQVAGSFGLEIRQAAEIAMRRGFRSAALDADVQLAWDVLNPDAVRFLQGRGAARVALIDQATANDIRAVLVRGLESGASYGSIAREISDLFPAYGRSRDGKRSRAELIAITETGEAYEHGRSMVAGRLEGEGLRMEKRWIVAGDERVCPICSGNDIGWIGNGESFPSGHGRPLAHPGCRCDMEVRAAE